MIAYSPSNAANHWSGMTYLSHCGMKKKCAFGNNDLNLGIQKPRELDVQILKAHLQANSISGLLLKFAILVWFLF